MSQEITGNLTVDGITTLQSSVTSQKNTLDDGSGNMTLAGSLSVGLSLQAWNAIDVVGQNSFLGIFNTNDNTAAGHVMLEETYGSLWVSFNSAFTPNTPVLTLDSSGDLTLAGSLSVGLSLQAWNAIDVVGQNSFLGIFNTNDNTAAGHVMLEETYGSLWVSFNSAFTPNTPVLTLDSSGDLALAGNMTLGANGNTLTLYTPITDENQTGTPVTIQAQNSGMDGNYPYPVLHVPGAGFEADDVIADGVLWTSSANLNPHVGGGAILMGFGYSTESDMPVIWLTDSDHSTLWLRAATYSNWASLILQDLTAYGWVYIAGSTQATGSGYGYLNSSGTAGYNSGSSGTVNMSLQTEYRIFCGGEIDVTSDQRDKNLIDTLNAQTALSAVMKLNPLHFAWKPETQKGNNVVAGFFAQEVAEAIPEAVIVYEGKRYTDEHTLNYNVLTTYALSAIQALTTEVEDLRSTIQQLTKVGAS